MFKIVAISLLLMIAIAVAPTLVAVALGVGAVFLSAQFIKFVLSGVIGTIVAIAILIYFFARGKTPPATPASPRPRPRQPFAAPDAASRRTMLTQSVKVAPHIFQHATGIYFVPGARGGIKAFPTLERAQAFVANSKTHNKSRDDTDIYLRDAQD